MIICPRCGYQAPDGSPWCPRCGYGCPYPMPPQQLQQPPQMPVPYQPQQIPARYDIVDMPPAPEQPRPKTKKRKKKKTGCLKIFLITIGVILGLFILILLIPSGSEPDPTTTPNMETLVAEMMDQAGTETAIAALSATPTFTIAPTFTATFTLIPTYTPYPTYTPFPEVPAAPSYTEQQTYTDNSYAQAGSSVRGSAVPSSSNNVCVVKGSESGKYHCSNSPNYNTLKNYVCFSSESEAIAAGYVMSGNMHGYCQQ